MELLLLFQLIILVMIILPLESIIIQLLIIIMMIMIPEGTPDPLIPRRYPGPVGVDYSGGFRGE